MDDSELVAHGNGYNFYACHGDCGLNGDNKGQGDTLSLKPDDFTVAYNYIIDPEHVVTKSASITMRNPDIPPALHTDSQEVTPEPKIVQAVETSPEAPMQQILAVPVVSEHVIPATGDTDTASTAGVFGALGALVTAAIAFVTHRGQRE